MSENNKKIEIARQFCQEVKELAKKYKMQLFIIYLYITFNA
jgi:radical SAM superfamily enzyme